MQLSHSFTVPAPLEETWAHFQDISAVAECFPGAKVTSAEGDDFSGSAKVKLGPVAMQYSGSGSFSERDDAAHRMVFEAKGKDKRGNGTAGAHVVLSFSAEDDSTTRAEVVTDLSVTGKPAQFGARMMQEVSDKLLGQFVDCLQQAMGSGGDAEEAAPTAAPAEPSPARGSEPTTPSVVPPSGGPGPSTAPTPTPASTPGAAAVTASSANGTVSGARTGGGAPVSGGQRPAGADDALDLGATVLPVLLRMYGKQIAAGLALFVVFVWLWRRRD